MKYTTYAKLQKIYNNLDLIDLINNYPNENILLDNKSSTIYINENMLKTLYPETTIECFNLGKNFNSLEELTFNNLNKNNILFYENSKEYTKDKKYLGSLKEKIKDLKSIINLFEKYQDIFFNKKVLCFDIEAYEDDQSKLTEFGITSLNNLQINTSHLIIEENIDLRNGKYVEDNKDNFLFGKSKIVSLDNAINELILNLKNSELIVGHGISNDFKFLNKVSNGKIKREDFEILDSLKLSKALNNNGLGLKKMLEHLNIEYSCLHNAGNDAHFNVKMLAQFLKEFDISICKEKQKELIEKSSKFEIYFNNKYIIENFENSFINR